jgi:hypothetical protein
MGKQTTIMVFVSVATGVVAAASRALIIIIIIITTKC